MDHEQVTIETPEHVNISYELAGPGSRLWASFLDHLIIVLGIATIVLVAVSFEVGMPDTGAPAVVAAAVAGGPLLLLAGYFALFETLWNGQTPGKRAAGIRVMRDDGTPAVPADCLIRNAVRIVDFLPYLYFVGGVTFFAHRQSKRLGDIAAGTVVVKLREQELPRVVEAATEQPTLPEDVLQVVRPSAASISGEEYGTVRRFLQRRFELAPEVRREMAARVIEALRPKLSPEAEAMAQESPEKLLEAIDQVGAQLGPRL